MTESVRYDEKSLGGHEEDVVMADVQINEAPSVTVSGSAEDSYALPPVPESANVFPVRYAMPGPGFMELHRQVRKRRRGG